MKRKGKDFPVTVKPLFQAMLELGQHKKGEGSGTYNESSSNGTDSGEGNRRCQETKGDNASDEDRSGEDSMECNNSHFQINYYFRKISLFTFYYSLFTIHLRNFYFIFSYVKLF
jgi:hypothetical protein